MIYKIKKSFGGYINFKADQIRLFTDAEAKCFEHLIEESKIGGVPDDSLSVNSIDGKPDKQYKKGRKKV